MAWHGLLSFDYAWLAWLNCACHPVLASTNMADSWLDDDDDDSCVLLFHAHPLDSAWRTWLVARSCMEHA